MSVELKSSLTTSTVPQDKTAFMKAISLVTFKSPRGDFKFDANSQNVVNPYYVRKLVNDRILDRQFGFLGERRVNVFSVNRAMDDLGGGK